MTVSGIILLTYFAIEIAKMSKEGEGYSVPLHSLHNEPKALVNDESRNDT